MPTVQELKNEMARIAPTLQRLANKIEDLADTTDADSLNIDEYSDFVTLYQLQESLEKVSRRIDFVSKPIEREGHLYKNSAGRYEIAEGDYFTSGSAVEILIEDDDRRARWVYTSIEHRGDYYATAAPDVKLDGIRARIRA